MTTHEHDGAPDRRTAPTRDDGPARPGTEGPGPAGPGRQDAGPHRLLLGLTVTLGLLAAVASAELWRIAPAVPLAVAVVVLGLVPAAVVLAASGRLREPAAVGWAAVGLGCTAGGVVAASPDRFLDLRLAAGDWELLVQSPTAVAPATLVVVGLALLAGAVGLLGSIRGTLVVVPLVTALAATGLAVTVLGGNGVLRYLARGGTASPDAFTGWGSAAAGTLVLVAGALVVLAVLAPRTASWPERRPSEREVRRRRLVGRVSAAVVAAVVLGFGIEAAWEHRAGTVLADEVPDPVFARCVAQAARTSVDRPVSRARLADVTALECTVPLDATDDRRITDLTGLELLPGLVHLDLTGHAVSDLRPVEGLGSLWSLRLTHNEVRDLTPLAGLTSLTDLGLSGNRVADLAPLADGPPLAYLGLADNEVRDVTPLEDVAGLVELDLSGNPVTDVAPLGGLAHLDRLVLRSTDVADPAPLAAAPALRVLDVSCSRVADASRLAGLASVSELWLGGNPLDDVAPLAGMPSLLGVDLAGTAHEVHGREALEATGVRVGGTAKGTECPPRDDDA